MHVNTRWRWRQIYNRGAVCLLGTPFAFIDAQRCGMAQTAADILIDTICKWGVDTIFGLPGDGINGIMESLRTKQEKIRFIQVRHEEAAAFMACAYAKFTGKLGV